MSTCFYAIAQLYDSPHLHVTVNSMLESDYSDPCTHQRRATTHICTVNTCDGWLLLFCLRSSI
jgi:hypothetical protein